MIGVTIIVGVYIIVILTAFLWDVIKEKLTIRLFNNYMANLVLASIMMITILLT